MKKEKDKFPSELRKDCNSGEWVVIATGRARRPDSFKSSKNQIPRTLKKDCFFCSLSEKDFPISFYYNKKKINFNQGDKLPRKWTTVVIPNKYPAFVQNDNLNIKKHGNFFESMNAVGYHEVVITSDHDKSIALMPKENVEELISAYVDRYSFLNEKENVGYVAIIHNHGPQAGASIYHPHSQIMAIPLIDSDLKTSMINAEKYLKKNNRCVYCDMMKWELKEKSRIVYENKDFVALCPYASKSAFQTIITPRKHSSLFQEITDSQKESLADAFKKVLLKLYKGLNNPSYNFYLHAAPSTPKNHSYYHWHWTILPKTSIWAGFELGVGIEISTVSPEDAASYLRKQKI